MPDIAADHRIPILVPDLGTEQETLRISSWLVEPGQTVVVGDRLVELLIPGITYDISATQNGELVSIVRHVDAIVSTGEVIGWLEPDQS
ncbi:MAG: lipoyl domain-containing protein [Planctomycetota bacterium]